MQLAQIQTVRIQRVMKENLTTLQYRYCWRFNKVGITSDRTSKQPQVSGNFSWK